MCGAMKKNRDRESKRIKIESAFPCCCNKRGITMKKRMMLQRVCSLALSLTMSAVFCAAPVSAISDGLTDLNGDGVVNVFDVVLAKRETVTASNPMILDISDIQAEPGEIVTLEIEIRNNPGFTSGTFMLQHDTMLEPVYQGETMVYSSNQIMADQYATVLPCGLHGTLICLAESVDVAEEDGTLFSIQFMVSEQAEAGRQYSLSLTDVHFYDAEETEISAMLLEKGSVTLPETPKLMWKGEKRPFSWGIDVSKWQGEINWELVKADEQKVDFVMIRAGSGWGDPAIQSDPYFAQHYEGATSVGLPVGAYWYSYALTPEEAVAEAETCLAVLGDRAFEFPIAYDLERKAQWAMSPEDFCAIVDAFCSTMEAAGCYVTVYSSATPLNNLYTEEMRMKYDVWVAQYAETTIYTGNYGMWQYSCTGSVDGINGDVDMNYCYYDYESMICENGFNNYNTMIAE